ncbi:MAG: sialate O-acetylesterase [Pseudomonadota bacterium]
MIRGLRLLVAVLLVGAGVAAGLLLALEAPGLRQTYIQAKYELRETLGLEKSWARLPSAAQAEGRETVDCPDPAETLVVVTGGQSNAANVIPAPAQAGPEATVWFDGACYPAADPVLGATGGQGSLWPPLADRLAAGADAPVLLINGAVGGTQVGDWVDDRSGYYSALAGRIATARDAGYEPRLILWHQGETDAAVERDMERFRGRLDALTADLLAEMPAAQLYLFRTTKCIGPVRADGVPAIRDVQSAVAEGNDRIVPGMDTDELGRDFRWDTCHFNSLGRREIVERVAGDLLDLVEMEEKG